MSKVACGQELGGVTGLLLVQVFAPSAPDVLASRQSIVQSDSAAINHVALFVTCDI